jgi:cell division protein FtsB
MSIVRHAALRRTASRFTGRPAILSVVVLGLLIAAIFPIRQLLGYRSLNAHLTREVQVVERRIAQLDRRIAQLHEPAYLERLARECLGMVKPGEVPFVVVPKGGGAKPAAC